MLPDEGGDDEGREAVGADDESIDGGRAALLLCDLGKEGWEEADSEGGGEGGHHQHAQDDQLPGRHPRGGRSGRPGDRSGAPGAAAATGRPG